MIIGVPDSVLSAATAVLIDVILALVAFNTSAEVTPDTVRVVTFAVVKVALVAPSVVSPVTLPPVIVALSAFCVAMVPIDVGGVGGKALEIKTQNAIMMIVQPVIIPIRSLMIPPIQSSNRSIT